MTKKIDTEEKVAEASPKKEEAVKEEAVKTEAPEVSKTEEAPKAQAATDSDSPKDTKTKGKDKKPQEVKVKPAQMKEQPVVAEEEEIKVVDRVVHISRVAKVVKGGRRFSFSALVVSGNGQGEVGYGLGKANEVPDAIRKGSEKARKTMIQVPLKERTIPHDVMGRYGAGRVVMKKASPGTGVIAGGAVRAVFESIGVHDILTKCIGTSNPHNVVRATFNGLEQLQDTGEKTESQMTL